MIAMSLTILLVCSALTVGDGVATWWGARNGLMELNPFLRHIMKKRGSIGLLATRAVALGLLLLLFDILGAELWIFFGSTFSLLLGLVLLNDLRKLRLQKRLA